KQETRSRERFGTRTYKSAAVGLAVDIVDHIERGRRAAKPGGQWPVHTLPAIKFPEVRDSIRRNRGVGIDLRAARYGVRIRLSDRRGRSEFPGAAGARSSGCGDTGADH